MTDAAELVATLEALATVAEREKYTRYFPPDPDAPFIGVRMGAVFDLAKTALDLPIPELEALLERPTHEVRALACSIMGKSAAAREDHRPSDAPTSTSSTSGRHDRIDQWDLVDLAARDVVGGYLLDRDRAPLARLAASAFWPERRTVARGDVRVPQARRARRRLRARGDARRRPRAVRAEGARLGAPRRRRPSIRPGSSRSSSRRAATMPRVALRAAIEHVPKDERARILAIR